MYYNPSSLRCMKKDAILGIALAAFSMKKNFLISVGVIMIIIGFIGSIAFGSIVINEAAQAQLNPTTQRPNPIYGIISPLYAEMVFIIIAVIGFGMSVVGATMHGEPSKQQ